MTSDLFVHHHLGMGDHLTLCGLVRTLGAQRGRVRIVAKECNAANVRFLYRDEKRIEVVPVPVPRDSPTNEAGVVALAHRKLGGEFLQIGHGHYARVEREAGGYIQNDQVFYRQLGVPYEYRFDRFHFDRDDEAEREVSLRANPTGEPYIFVDRDLARGRQAPDTVESVRRDPRVKIVYNDASIPLLHLGTLLEEAEEIHVSESAVRCLVEGSLFDMRKPKLYLQGNLRGNNTRLPWIFSAGVRALTYPMYRGPAGSPTPNGHEAGPFSMRSIAPSDVDMLASFFSLLAGDPYFAPHPMTAEAAAGIAKDRSRDFYAIATIGSEAVGYGMLRGLEEGYPVPSLGIAVHPRHRGRGVGHRMMAFLHGEARRIASEVRLRVKPENVPAIRFYRAFGYEPVGDERGQTLMIAKL